MAAQRLGKRVLSKLQAPSRARGPGGSPGGLQKRHARVTVKYDRRELQRRLDVEKWIDGRLEELYRGREADMPDEVNIDELLELESEEERSRKIQGLLKSCTNPTELLSLIRLFEIPWTVAYHGIFQARVLEWVAIPPEDLTCFKLHPKGQLLQGAQSFSSVALSCLTLCDPMNRSTPGLPVHHQLPEFTQTRGLSRH
uniref:Protein phosphatase 1 regulatory inhibitor subunit 14A n=1 Tax=Ovis aries TaxID=9940 RepID=A0AC11ERL1_SHEEP